MTSVLIKRRGGGGGVVEKQGTGGVCTMERSCEDTVGWRPFVTQEQ